MLDQAEGLRRLVENKLEKKPTKIITIASGKGGVGKSNVVVNLALALSKQGKRVLIFDADLGMGNDDVIMGIFPKYTIFNILQDGLSIKEVITEGPLGVMLLSAGSGINHIEDLEEEERAKFLNGLKELQGFDYILIDTGAGINKSLLAFISSSQELFVVTTPEPTSIVDAYSLLKAVNHFKLKTEAKVIVNKALSHKEARETFSRFQAAVTKFLTIKVEYLGGVLEDKKLTMAVRKQSPLLLEHPESSAAKDIEAISRLLLGEDKPLEGANMQDLFRKIFSIFS